MTKSTPAAAMKGKRKPSAALDAKKPAQQLPAPIPKSQVMTVKLEPGETPDMAHARLATRGMVSNASTAIRYLRRELGDLSLMDMAQELKDQGNAINSGDLSQAERLLNAQAVALDTIFANLARRASENIGTHLSSAETYLRLALKAQGQCRATVQTLAEMKNPRAVSFVKQANITSGPQQVNNGQPLQAHHADPART